MVLLECDQKVFNYAKCSTHGCLDCTHCVMVKENATAAPTSDSR